MAVARTRRPLNRARVLAAAVAVADAEGVEALTIRRLADELGVHATSLYNHVPSKEAILDGVVEVLFEEAALPTEVASWQEWVRALADRLRALARAHPGAFLVLVRRPASTPPALAQSELGLDAFVRGGFSVVEAAHALKGASLAILGMALNECSALGEAPPPEPTYPPGSRLAEADAQIGGLDDGHWGVTVDALVAGLEQVVRARRSSG